MLEDKNYLGMEHMDIHMQPMSGEDLAWKV